jgi:hypothetical protein
MADITVRCTHCDATMTVSEFADLAAVACRACGRGVQAANDAPAAGARAKLTLKRDAPPDPTQAPVEAPILPSDDVVPAGTRVALRPRSWRPSQLAVSVLISLVLGAVMAYLRYGGGLDEDSLAQFRRFGPALALVFHVFLVWKAFEDSIFQGILCLLVPLYSAYYLFMVSDRFFLRAIAAGLLVGIGQDTLVAMNTLTRTTIVTVNDWISRGGGTIW